jgi:hypothetical protein
VKLYIPALKSEVKLTKAATVPIYHESRNFLFAKAAGVTKATVPYFSNGHDGEIGFETHYSDERGMKKTPVILPAGTVLIFDRYYIRNGADEFDSITFRIGDCPSPKLRKKRFWLKLGDVNGLDVTPA